MSSFDLIGVGSPIMDLLARVPDEFLAKQTGPVRISKLPLSRVPAYIRIE